MHSLITNKQTPSDFKTTFRFLFPPSFISFFFSLFLSIIIIYFFSPPSFHPSFLHSNLSPSLSFYPPPLPPISLAHRLRVGWQAWRRDSGRHTQDHEEVRRERSRARDNAKRTYINTLEALIKSWYASKYKSVREEYIYYSYAKRNRQRIQHTHNARNTRPEQREQENFVMNFVMIWGISLWWV